MGTTRCVPCYPKFSKQHYKMSATCGTVNGKKHTHTHAHTHKPHNGYHSLRSLLKRHTSNNSNQSDIDSVPAVPPICSRYPELWRDGTQACLLNILFHRVSIILVSVIIGVRSLPERDMLSLRDGMGGWRWEEILPPPPSPPSPSRGCGGQRIIEKVHVLVRSSTYY